ncbi:nad dependent epimerase dehydratase like protein [Zymoseptoria brevis]|uniref:Nad dependent epimerase dehydratase like protein n=1 Tax=Zymoseptoria brevis TaxID=1047168 RepID=A0A0F4GHZ0_9PEZI|nr:nad dependent epimerase dehydratase like protein [Zymoseptoria brevis]
MGAEASKPQTGAKLQVIGAGLSRTGTSSFSAALSTLLHGPVYHGGTQTIVSGDETHIKTWISILQHTPYRSPSDKAFVLDALRTLTTGYVACADAPFAQFVPELREIYPDAIVLCTVRDPEAWARSMGDMATASLQALLAVMLFWVPCLRWLPRYLDAMMEGRYRELYRRAGEGKEVMYGRAAWERHLEYLRMEVPEEKLFLVDVKDGWEPICRALGVKAPIGVEFPRINDGSAIERLARESIRTGLVRWAAVLAGLVGGIAVVWRQF